MNSCLYLSGGGDENLSQIETVWAIIFQAHGEGPGDRGRAQQELISRYGDAILRYLRGAFRDESLAEEAFHEFVLRLYRGDYRHVHPQKGRFRGFLKVVLSRLVADHYRVLTRRRELPLETSVEIPDASVTQESERSFDQTWRDEMLTKAWQRLGEEERRASMPWMTILRMRVENPELRSIELAAMLADRLGEQVTPSRQRVLLHRSREKFANHLIDAVSDSIESDSIDDVEEELAQMELLQYCDVVLDRRRVRSKLEI